MRKSVPHFLLLFISLISLITLPQAQQTDQIQGQVIMRAGNSPKVSQPVSGAASLAPSSFDTFDGFVRFPSEINNRFFQMQQGGTAYYRDFFTGGETTDQGVDGQSISAQMVTADNQTLSFGSITFFANLNGQQDCWVGPGETICNASTLIVTWFAQTQCFTTGTFTMTFFRQGAAFATSTFQITPTIPPHTVPGDINDPVPGDPPVANVTNKYNQGSYSTIQYGDFCSFPVTVNGRTRNVVGHCDPVAHPTETIMHISALGCALTDATMVLGYFGAFTDPPTLNTYLTNHGGYNDSGGIRWPVIQQYAATRNLGLGFKTTGNSGTAVRNPSCSKGPVIIPVQHTVGNSPAIHHHFVTTWGQQGDPATTLLLKDPNGGIGDLLSGTTPPRNYNNNYFGTREFQGPDQNFTIPTFNGNLTVTIHSPAELLITNSAGQQTGFDPTTNTSFDQIPNSAYIDDSITDVTDDSDTPAQADSKVLDLGAPAADTFTLTVTGTDFGTYSLEFVSFDPNFQPASTAIHDVPTSPGAVQTFTFTTPIVAGQPFPLSGAFDGGGQRPKDVNHFLSYANPTSSSTTLPTGTTSFPLMIFYDSRDIASTFTAVLNGSDVSSMFHPAPGTFEVVNIPLVGGSNVLKLSIDGNLPSRVATDTDRLVFDVK
jgi:hypothetical protein